MAAHRVSSRLNCCCGCGLAFRQNVGSDGLELAGRRLLRRELAHDVPQLLLRDVVGFQNGQPMYERRDRRVRVLHHTRAAEQRTRSKEEPSPLPCKLNSAT